MLIAEYIIFLCVGLVVLIWLSTIIAFHYLLHLTRREFPELIGSEVTVPFYASPRNLIYFLKKESKITLLGNKKISKLRKVCITLLIWSVAFPCLFFIVMAVFVWFQIK